MSNEPQEMNLPSPWRCCRLQLMAFLLLTLLGSCVHSDPTPPDNTNPLLISATPVPALQPLQS